MCVPSWESPAVFSGLLGGAGGCAITPADPRFVWGGYYEPGSLVWTSRWVTTDSIIESQEALAAPASAGAHRILAETARTNTHPSGRWRRAPDDDRPLGDAEGAFLLCGFVTALAEHHSGQSLAALRRFERNRAACGPPGLFAEEYDVHQRQLRGNLPQAFVHAMMLEASVTLS
jgi:hypothetical protein